MNEFRRELFGEWKVATPKVADIAPRPWQVKPWRDQRGGGQTWVVHDGNGKWVAECGDPYVAHCIAVAGPDIDERQQRYLQSCAAFVADVAKERWDEQPYMDARKLASRKP